MPKYEQQEPQKKLSTLIREGAKLTQFTKGSVFHKDPYGCLKACALGAAFYAKYGYGPHNTEEASRGLGLVGVEIPVIEIPVNAFVVDLNDRYDGAGDPRPGIADKLEALGL